MGYISSFDAQVDYACKKLEKEQETLKDGFTLIGFSQGGLIARGVLQKCEVGKYIRRLITFGAPHSGVALIPFTAETSFMNKTVLRLCFYGFIQNHVGPCGYIRSSRYYDSYQSSKNFIADLNNEFNDNLEYKKRVEGLDVFMAVQFLDDQMVQPHNTSIFGYFKDQDYKEYSEMEDLDIYKKDSVGLQSLHTKGKLIRCDIDGDHLQIAPEDMQSFAVLAGDSGKGLAEIKEDSRVQTRCRYL